MLTPNQEKYLLTIPAGKIARIVPYNPKIREAMRAIEDEIRKVIPDLEIVSNGSSALGIAGQNDIDMQLLSSPNEYGSYLPVLAQLFGPPVKRSLKLIKWEFLRGGFEVELYLTDRNSAVLQDQMKTFRLLQQREDLRKEYQQLKLECNGIKFREYMRRKYEFFNRILGIG